MKAFIFDPIWDKLINEDLLDKLENSGLELIVKTEVAPLSDCKELFLGDEDRILCLNPDYVGWELKSDDYRQIPNLKGIFTESTSFSWINQDLADEENIPVCNIKNFSTQAVAEWAITQMFNISRCIPLLIKDEFPLDFADDFFKYRGIELMGKTAAIIGLGNIGSAIAERCAGLGMNVIYWSKSPKQNSYVSKQLKEIFVEADVVFPTMAVNEESKTVVNNELIDSMKTSAMLIAVEHHLFDLDFVVNKVKKSEIFGFGFEADPGSFQNYKGNVWAAPAYGWVTKESMDNSMVKWIDNMVEAVSGSFPNRVN